MGNNKDENKGKVPEKKTKSTGHKATGANSKVKTSDNKKIVNIWDKLNNEEKKEVKKEKPAADIEPEEKSEGDRMGGIKEALNSVFSFRVKKSKPGSGKRFSTEKRSSESSKRTGYVSRYKRPSEKKNPQRYEKAVVRGSDREVLSYEELPIENYERKVTAKETVSKKRVGAAAVILLVICIVVFAVTSRNIMSLESCANWIQYDLFGYGSNSGYPVLISGSEVSSGNVMIMSNKFAYASNSNIVALDSSGNQIFNRQHSYSTPVMVGNGTRSLTYDLGGKGFRIDSLDEVVYESTGDLPIITADIGKNGSYAIVTQHDEYISYMRVFNSSNEEVYAYAFSEYYINTVSVSDDGSKIVASGLSAKNGEPVSAVYYLSISEETPVEFFEIDNTVVYSVEYLTADKVAFVGNNSCGVIDISKNEVVRNSFNDMELTAYDIDKDLQSIVISLSRNGDGRLCSLYVYGSNGQIETSFDTQCRIISLDAYANKIGVIDNGTARLFDKSGTELNHTDAGADAAALIMDGQREAYVLGISEIRYIDFTDGN